MTVAEARSASASGKLIDYGGNLVEVIRVTPCVAEVIYASGRRYTVVLEP